MATVSRWAKYLCFSAVRTLFMALGIILKYICPNKLKKAIADKCTVLKYTPDEVEGYVCNLVSVYGIIAILRHYFYPHFITRKAFNGVKAPNVKLYSLDGKPLMLLDLVKAGRPLVLNFGSCT